MAIKTKRFEFFTPKKVDPVSAWMREVVDEVAGKNIIPIRPIRMPKEPNGPNWLIGLEKEQEFICGAASDCFLAQYRVEKKHQNGILVLLKEIKVEGKLDLSTPQWVNSKIFSRLYELQGLLDG